MDERTKYDNWFSSGVTVLIGTLVRTFERSIVVFWDGLRNATIHGTPSLLGFVAAVSPIIAPLGTAIQTAFSLSTYMGMMVFQAVVLAVSIEFIGFELWVFATEALLRDGWKGTMRQVSLALGVIVYEAILILINVALASQDVQKTTAWILFLWCLLPALASLGYSYQNLENKALLERDRREQIELAEKIRQEKRQDRKEAQALKMQEKIEKPFRK